MEYFYIEYGKIERGYREAHDQDDIDMIIDELEFDYADEWFETYDDAMDYAVVNDLLR